MSLDIHMEHLRTIAAAAILRGDVYPLNYNGSAEGTVTALRILLWDNPVPPAPKEQDRAYLIVNSDGSASLSIKWHRPSYGAPPCIYGLSGDFQSLWNAAYERIICDAVTMFWNDFEKGTTK